MGVGRTASGEAFSVILARSSVFRGDLAKFWGVSRRSISPDPPETPGDRVARGLFRAAVDHRPGL
jgi:hypothetical protein